MRLSPSLTAERLALLHPHDRPTARGVVVCLASRNPCSWLLRAGQSLAGSRGPFTQCGVVGDEYFYWSMTRVGLSFTWLGRAVQQGDLVAVLDPLRIDHYMFDHFATERGIRKLKEIFRTQTKHSVMKLLTAGRFGVPGYYTSSDLVRVYLEAVTYGHPKAKEALHSMGCFMTPNDIVWQLPLVALINQNLWESSRWTRQLRQRLSPGVSSLVLR